MEEKQMKKKEVHDASARSHKFSVGDTVYVQNFGGQGHWCHDGVVDKWSSILSGSY
jgi:hypothetical protein